MSVLASSEVSSVSQQERLIDLLACPKCHGSLRHVAGPEGYVCETCHLFYAVSDGLPNMLIDDAKPWPLGHARTS
jgi:uncharacterized protein YbaR (Trm112 family)